jgi:purine-binding chemotaxis protein CheW
MKRAGIDWDGVRERLRASDAAVADTLSGNPERIALAYRSRAVWLANGETGPMSRSAGAAVLVFGLAQERYAIELQELAEVLPLPRRTRVPGASPEFWGVIHVRGELRIVVDLGRLLAPSECAGGESGFVLMLRRPGREIGLKVDRIADLCEIRPEELDTPVHQGNYLKGIASGTLALLSVDAVLSQVFSKEEAFTK